MDAGALTTVNLTALPLTRELHPNLGFDTGTVPMRFKIRTLLNTPENGTEQCPFWDVGDGGFDNYIAGGRYRHRGLVQVDLYFEYGSNDNPAN